MILGSKILLKLVKEKKLVESLSERELTNPEGAGFDLRLGEVYQIEGRAFLGIKDRETPRVRLMAKYEEKLVTRRSSHNYTIQPGEFYLVTTVEKINLPLNICATFIPRTTTFRSGLFLRTGIAHPGYRGKLTFGLKNEGPVPVILEMGCRMVHIQFHWVDGRGNPYRGQWQWGSNNGKKRKTNLNGFRFNEKNLKRHTGKYPVSTRRIKIVNSKDKTVVDDNYPDFLENEGLKLLVLKEKYIITP